jgi:hypothetical protein
MSFIPCRLKEIEDVNKLAGTDREGDGYPGFARVSHQGWRISLIFNKMRRRCYSLEKESLNPPYAMVFAAE